MNKIYLIYFLLVSFISFSQLDEDIKNLEIKLATMKIDDSSKVKVLNELAGFLENVAPLKGKNYALQSLKIANKIKYERGIYIATRYLGANYLNLSDYKNALKTFQTALKLSNNEKRKNRNLASIGLTYGLMNNYPKALEYGLKALQISEKMQDTITYSDDLCNIGLVYSDLKDYKKAMYYEQKSLKLVQNTKNKQNIAISLGNISNIYAKTNQFEKSIEYSIKTGKVFEEINDIFNLAIVYNSIADCYLSLKQYDNAIQYNAKSRLIIEKVGEQNILNSVNSLDADIYYQKGLLEKNPVLIDKSINILKNVIGIYKKNNNIKELGDDYVLISKMYSSKNDYKNAFESQKLAIIYKDSIYNSENKETIKNLEDQQKIDLRDNKLKLNTVKIESHKKEKWFLVAGLLLLAVIGSLLFYQNQNKKKINQQLSFLNNNLAAANENLDQSNKTKIRFFNILNHDLRNPVVNLIQYLQFQKESPNFLSEVENEKLKNKSVNAAENLLKSMDDILLWSKGQMENFSPQPQKIQVSNLFQDIKNHFVSEEKVNFTFVDDENLQIFTDENYLKTIIRNLTGNAIKATSIALSETIKPAIIWNAFSKNNNKYLTLTDNGKGMSNDKLASLYDENQIVGIKSGLGFHLIRDLATSINCEIAVESTVDVGTTFILKFNS